MEKSMVIAPKKPRGEERDTLTPLLPEGRQADVGAGQ